MKEEKMHMNMSLCIQDIFVSFFSCFILYGEYNRCHCLGLECLSKLNNRCTIPIVLWAINDARIEKKRLRLSMLPTIFAEFALSFLNVNSKRIAFLAYIKLDNEIYFNVNWIQSFHLYFSIIKHLLSGARFRYFFFFPLGCARLGHFMECFRKEKWNELRAFSSFLCLSLSLFYSQFWVSLTFELWISNEIIILLFDVPMFMGEKWEENRRGK